MKSLHQWIPIAALIFSVSALAGPCTFVPAATRLSSNDQRVQATAFISLPQARDCSAVLVASTDSSQQGRLLTAAHCVYEAGGMAGGTLDVDIAWLALGTTSPTSASAAAQAFTYATATIAYLGPPSSTDYNPDIALLLLPASVVVPPGVYFSGFDATPGSATSAASLTALGFPSDSSSDPMQMQFSSGTAAAVGDLIGTVENYTVGGVGPGSSGSPIFRDSDDQLVAVNWGGSSSPGTCDSQGSAYELSAAWAGLQPFLDPSNTSETAAGYASTTPATEPPTASQTAGATVTTSTSNSPAGGSSAGAMGLDVLLWLGGLAFSARLRHRKK